MPQIQHPIFHATTVMKKHTPLRKTDTSLVVTFLFLSPFPLSLHLSYVQRPVYVLFCICVSEHTSSVFFRQIVDHVSELNVHKAFRVLGRLRVHALVFCEMQCGVRSLLELVQDRCAG